MTKAIVTGGCGFIGSNLVDKLVEMGWEVCVIDNNPSSGYVNGQANYLFADICEIDRHYNEVFENADYVFHLAAEVKIQDCIKNPELAIKTNVLGTFNMLEQARKAGVKRFLFSSTAAIYGSGFRLGGIKEDTTTDCLNPYSITKFTGEQLCKMYSDLYDLETVVFRYFNVYGKRQHSQGQYAPVMGVFNRQISAGEPMTVVGDGVQTRDYINVGDVVNANVLFSKQFAEFRGDVFNIGTGKKTSVLDLVEMLGGKDAEYCNLPPREGEVKHSVADIDKAKSFGWNPQVNLEEWINEQSNSL